MVFTLTMSSGRMTKGFGLPSPAYTDPPAVTPAVAQAPAEEAPATTGYRTTQDIMNSGELIMLTSTDFVPFEYGMYGEIVGVDVDLVRMIADSLGVTLTIVDMEFESLVYALANGEGDIIASGMTATQERAEFVDFSEVYYGTALNIIVPPGSDITGMDDLYGKVVVAQNGVSEWFILDNLDTSNIFWVDNAFECAEYVLAGIADASVLDRSEALGIMASVGDALVLLDENLNDQSFSMAVAKGNTTLLDVVNAALFDARMNGIVSMYVQHHKSLNTGG